MVVLGVLGDCGHCEVCRCRGCWRCIERCDYRRASCKGSKGVSRSTAEGSGLDGYGKRAEEEVKGVGVLIYLFCLE